MHIVLIIFIIVVVIGVALSVYLYLSGKTCPHYGYGCASATPMFTTSPWTDAPSITNAPVSTTTNAPVSTTTNAPVLTTAPPQLYTQLLSSQTDLASKQLTAMLPTFGTSPFQYTLTMWIKIPIASSQWRNVVRFGPDDSHRTPALYIFPGNTNLHYRHATSTNSNPGFDSIAGVSLNVWAHFVVSVTNRTMTSYVDGTAGSHFTADADFLLPTDKVYFNPGPNPPFDTTSSVSVADVRFYPKALSSDDVNIVYNSSKATAVKGA